jgi:hypothetical protein
MAKCIKGQQMFDSYLVDLQETLIPALLVVLGNNVTVKRSGLARCLDTGT